MSARFLLDTNICVYIRQRRPPEVMARFDKLSTGEAVVSVITYGELLYGVEKNLTPERALKAFEEISGRLPVLPMPVEAGRIYGKLRTFLAAKGEMIGGNDLWIAAHAKAAQLTLVTNNEREFKRVPGLKIENWTK
jgi:tRNA(fMet)-specific endonuclease VapC